MKLQQLAILLLPALLVCAPLNAQQSAPPRKFVGLYVPPSTLMRASQRPVSVKLPAHVAGPEAPINLSPIAGGVVFKSGKVCKPCSDTEMGSLKEQPGTTTPQRTAVVPHKKAVRPHPVAAMRRSHPVAAMRRPHHVAAMRRSHPVAAMPHIASSHVHRKSAVAARPKLIARVAMSNGGSDCESLRRQAQAFMDRGETEAADRLLKKALEAEPGRPCLRTMVARVALCRARSAISCNYLECAARRLREVLYLEPNNRTASALLNDVYSAAGVDPDNGGQRQQLAQCLATNGRNVGALVEYREALKLNNSPSTHIGLANAALNTDQKTLALSEFRKVVGIDPFNPRAWQSIGFLEESRGHLEKAASAFLEAGRINPVDPIAVEKALQLNQKLVSMFPKNIERKLDLARAYLLTDQSNKAADEYQQVVKMQPGTPSYDEWITVESENIALKRAGFEHHSSGEQLASNDLYKFLNEGPQPNGGDNQVDATAKLKRGCKCD